MGVLDMEYFHRLFPTGFCHELIETGKLAVPVVVTNFLQMFPGTMVLLFCGRLRHLDMAVAALSISLVNIGGMSVVLGLAGACETLYSQTYGSKKRHKLATVVTKGTILLFLMLMPSYALFINSERLLIAIGQDPFVSRNTEEYLTLMIPGLAAYAVYMSLCKYLQCQGLTVWCVVIAFIANLVCALMHYIFLWKLHWGTNGSALALDACFGTLLILTILYIFLSGVYKETWSGISCDVFLGWGQFIKYAYTAFIMVGFKWYTEEICTILAGILGTVQLNAQAVAFQVEALAYMIPLGLGIASSYRVGQYLGQASSEGAITSARVGILVSVIFGIAIGVVLGAAHHYLPLAFTNHPEVVDLAGKTLDVVAIELVFSCINGVACGLLRGMGKQTVGSVIMFVLYSLSVGAGVPTMLLTNAGIVGYWTSYAVATFLETIILSCFLWRVNWTNEVNIALERTSHATADDKEKHTFTISEKSESKESTELLSMSTYSKKNSTFMLLVSRTLIIGGYCGVFIIAIILRLHFGRPDISAAYMCDKFFHTNCTLPANATTPPAIQF